MRSFAEIDFAELVDHARVRIVGGVVFSAVPVMFSVVFSLFMRSHTNDSFVTGVITYRNICKRLTSTISADNRVVDTKEGTCVLHVPSHARLLWKTLERR